MRPTLTCLPILAALTIPASAQSNDRAFPIPEGRAYFCEYTVIPPQIAGVHL
jgi:hypothetical protein